MACEGELVEQQAQIRAREFAAPQDLAFEKGFVEVKTLLVEGLVQGPDPGLAVARRAQAAQGVVLQPPRADLAVFHSRRPGQVEVLKPFEHGAIVGCGVGPVVGRQCGQLPVALPQFVAELFQQLRQHAGIGQYQDVQAEGIAIRRQAQQLAQTIDEQRFEILVRREGYGEHKRFVGVKKTL